MTDHAALPIPFHGGFSVHFVRSLDVARPRLEKERGWRNLTAGERNKARLADWERRRRVEFPNCYVDKRSGVIHAPPWTRPELEKLSLPAAHSWDVFCSSTSRIDDEMSKMLLGQKVLQESSLLLRGIRG